MTPQLHLAVNDGTVTLNPADYVGGGSPIVRMRVDMWGAEDVTELRLTPDEARRFAVLLLRAADDQVAAMTEKDES